MLIGDLDLSVLVTEELYRKSVTVLGGKVGFHRPILLRGEGADLRFSLGDNSYSRRLHATAGKTALNIFPKNRAKAEADQTIQNSTRLLRVYEILVDCAGMADRILYRRFRYLVEGNAAGLIGGNAKLTRDVPGNGLSLTVRVRCKKDLACILGFLLQLLDYVALAADIDIMRRKAIFHVNSKTALGKVADMPLGGNYFIARAEIALDRVCFCGRLYDD